MKCCRCNVTPATGDVCLKGAVYGLCARCLGIVERFVRTLPTAERFWAKVNRDGPVAREGLGPCWIWRGCKNPVNGYAKFRINRETFSGHRVAWFLEHGEWPDKLVCHKCDVRACVNPEHLFLGTQSENIRDCRDKGRLNRSRGERHRSAKLTESQVREIRASDDPQATLVSRYGVNSGSISRIRRRQTWRHVV